MAISVKMLGTTTNSSARQMQTRKSLERHRFGPPFRATRPHVVPLTQGLLPALRLLDPGHSEGPHGALLAPNLRRQGFLMAFRGVPPFNIFKEAL